MNFHDYLNRQNNEDRRAFVIHFPAKSGKTSFARRVCETRQDAHLLDLQRYFLEHPELPPIQQCDASMLKNLLLSQDHQEGVLVIDNPDFLLNTWSKEEKRALVHWLRVQLRSPADTDATYILVIQTDDIIANADMLNSRDEPRVLALNQFDAL